MKFLLVALFILFSSGTFALATHPEPGASPCGETKDELAYLTKYWQYRWATEHRDMTPDEVAHFLKMNNLGNSDIIGVRVFRSTYQPTYALVAYRLFENFLNGRPLVQLNCVVRLNGTFGLNLNPLELQDMMGKTFLEFGVQE